jgi:uncharacterized protein YcfL
MNATGFSSLHAPYRRSPARRVAFWCLPCAVFCLVAVDAARLVADWQIATCSQSGNIITVYLNSIFGQGSVQLAWETYYDSNNNLEYENQGSTFSVPANSTNYPASTGDVTNGDSIDALTTYVFVEPLHGGDKYCPNGPFPTFCICDPCTAAVPSNVRKGTMDTSYFAIAEADIQQGAPTAIDHYNLPLAMYSLNNYTGTVTLSYRMYWEDNAGLHLIYRDTNHPQQTVTPATTMMAPVKWTYDVNCHGNSGNDAQGHKIPACAHFVVMIFAGNKDQGTPLRVEFEHMQWP